MHSISSRLCFTSLFSAALSFSTGCGASDDQVSRVSGSGSSPQTSGTGGESGGLREIPFEPSTETPDLGLGGEGGGTAVVYAHSKDELYKLDPLSLDVTKLGVPKCEPVDHGSFIDLAVNRDGDLVLAAGQYLFKVDPETVACSLIGTSSSGSYPNSLAFVPGEIFGEKKDVLVGYGYASDKYYRIDPATGAQTELGSFGVADYIASGDIVSVKGGRTLVTAKYQQFGVETPSDHLFEIDPQTGSVVKDWGRLEVQDVWGLTQWGGRAFGFTNAGTAIEVIFDGDAMTVNPVDLGASGEGVSFWGAGSTTVAPVAIKWPVIR